MSYQTLDNIADGYIPLLALLSLISLCVSIRFNTQSLSHGVKQLGLLLLMVLWVYGLMFLDNALHIWPSLGMAYSTHTALALAFVYFLTLRHGQFTSALFSSMLAYALLMLYQQYHSLADILSTALVIIPGLMAIKFIDVRLTGSSRINHV